MGGIAEPTDLPNHPLNHHHHIFDICRHNPLLPLSPLREIIWFETIIIVHKLVSPSPLKAARFFPPISSEVNPYKALAVIASLPFLKNPHSSHLPPTLVKKMYKLNLLAVILMFGLSASAAAPRALKQAKVLRGDEPMKARGPWPSPSPKRGPY